MILFKKKAIQQEPEPQRSPSGIPLEFRFNREYCERFLATDPRALKLQKEFEEGRAYQRRYAQQNPYKPVEKPVQKGRKK